LREHYSILVRTAQVLSYAVSAELTQRPLGNLPDPLAADAELLADDLQHF
jgi:hypothetical protein